MFLIIWQYKVKPSEETRFVELYNAEGRWAEFFRGDSAYQGTVLVKSIPEEYTYVTLDYWDSEEEYRDFASRNSEEYASIDRECEELTDSETRIGEYTTP